MIPRSKTVRFSDIIQFAGQPKLYTPWIEPDKDPELKRAIREHRVMTLRQANVGTRKDFGEIGFSADNQVSYLIFPRSLRQFDGRKIVGIKYDRFETGK